MSHPPSAHPEVNPGGLPISTTPDTPRPSKHMGVSYMQQGTRLGIWMVKGGSNKNFMEKWSF